MISDGDVTDVQPGDASLIKSLRTGYGSSLFLDRNLFDMTDIGTYTATTALDGYAGAKSYIDDGSLIICSIYNADDGNVYIDYASKSSEAAAATGKSKVILPSTTVSGGHLPERFIYNRGIMRFGADKDVHGGTIDMSRGASDILTEHIDGEGAAVVNPELWDDTDSVLSSDGTKSLDQYGKHTIGLQLSSVATNYTATVFAGKYITYGISFVYDGWQESPIEIAATSYQTSSDIDGVRLKILQGNDSGSDANLDPRITSINVYRAILDVDGDVSTNDFYLLYSVDSNTSASPAIVDDDGNSESWVAGLGSGGTSTTLDYVTMIDLGFPRSQSYYVRTGVDSFNRALTSSGARKVVVEFDHYWDMGIIVKGRAVVRTLKYMDDGKYIEPIRTLSISEPGMPDVFYPNSTISFESSGGGTISSIKNLGPDRIILFDETSATVVNVSNDPQYWFVERIISIGIDDPGKVCSTDSGVVVVNERHLYLITDYGDVKFLTLNNESFWNDCDVSSAIVHYDSFNNVVYATRITKDFASTGVIYDFKRNRFLQWTPRSHADGSVVGFSGRVYFIDVNSSSNIYSFYKIGDDSSSIDIEFDSKNIDVSTATVPKILRAVTIIYKSASAVYLQLYDETGAIGSAQTMPAASNPTQFTLRLSRQFRKLRLKINGSLVGSFEIQEIAVESYMRAV